MRAPSVGEVRRIAAIPNPVIRNLEITNCYSRLAAAFADDLPEILASTWIQPGGRLIQKQYFGFGN